MIPADGSFPVAIQKGNHKAGEIQGQTRQHARLINLLGVKQLIVGVNKMDCDVAKYTKERYTEIADEMRNMMVKVGWKQEFITESVPVLPISGIYKIKGVGDVLAGRVEQGIVTPKKDVIFLPTHTSGVPCQGSVFTVEMHHKRVEQALPGDNVGMNIKGLNTNNMPHSGDVMIYKGDTTLKPVKNFTAQIQTLDIPGELKPGYSPIGFVRCGRAACKLVEIEYKKGKETGGNMMQNPHSLKSNEMAQAKFEPVQPLIVDSFKNCEGLSRIAFLDGNTAVMLGKIVKVETKEI
jgi:elongation factor 1-alpha